VQGHRADREKEEGAADEGQRPPETASPRARVVQAEEEPEARDEGDAEVFDPAADEEPLEARSGPELGGIGEGVEGAGGEEETEDQGAPEPAPLFQDEGEEQGGEEPYGQQQKRVDHPSAHARLHF